MASSRGQHRYSPYQKPERPKMPEPADKPLRVDEVEQEVPRTWQTGMPRCPVHPQYAMTEREINTKNGPANLHHCPHEECVIACFGTKEQLDEYLYHVVRSLHFTFRHVHCPLVCFCFLSPRRTKTDCFWRAETVTATCSNGEMKPPARKSKTIGSGG